MCIAACPKKCIRFETRTLGAVFPVVDETKCVDCGRCDSVCPMIRRVLHPSTLILSDRKVYAAYAKDVALWNEGSSGGMFPVIAHKLIDGGYEVYGAAFDEHLQLHHICAHSHQEIRPLFKSKYILSDTIAVYEEISQKLKNGKKVLYVGAPCQVTALKNYLGKLANENVANLVLIDFFCHGVPSQRFFDECLQYEDKKHHEKTLEYRFRVKKKNGSTMHYYGTVVQKGKKRIKRVRLYFNSLYYAAFQQYVSLRESCYNCWFNGEERSSDITIADFHEIEEYVSGQDRFKGMSKVLVNTQCGQELFETVRSELAVFDIDTEKLKRNGGWFGGVTERPKKRDEFVKHYNEFGIDGLAHRELNKRKYWKHKIYYRMPRCIRNELLQTFRGE